MNVGFLKNWEFVVKIGGYYTKIGGYLAKQWDI